jgi:hypothetical protein
MQQFFTLLLNISFSLSHLTALTLLTVYYLLFLNLTLSYRYPSLFIVIGEQIDHSSAKLEESRHGPTGPGEAFGMT